MIHGEFMKPTPNGILYEIIKQIDPETKIPMKGFFRLLLFCFMGHY